MKSLLAAISFLTRLPVGRLVEFDAADVSRSAVWFPLVGALLGVVASGAVALLRNHLPAGLLAVLLVVLEALLTGALHFDGLADTCDGFGGGKTRDDVLRIMRDHAIGTYGGVALASLVALKVTAYSALLQRSDFARPFLLAPALGRWSILLLTAALPYARATASVVKDIGQRWTLVAASAMAAIGLVIANSGLGWVAAGAVVIVTSIFGAHCRRRIGGVTGDTLGANVEICECAVLVTFCWIGSPS